MRRVVLFILAVIIAVLMRLQVESERKQLSDSVVLFDADIKPIFMQRCTACHNTPGWNFTDYETAFKKRFSIKTRVYILKNMPQGNVTGMTDNERELVKEWVDRGAKR